MNIDAIKKLFRATAENSSDVDSPSGLNTKPDGGARATVLNKKPLFLGASVLAIAAAGVMVGMHEIGQHKPQLAAVQVVPGKVRNVSLPPPKPSRPVMPATDTAGAKAKHPAAATQTATAATQSDQTTAAPADNKQPTPQQTAEQQAFSQQLGTSWQNDQAGGQSTPPPAPAATVKSDGESGAAVYDAHLVRRPASPYELQAGSVISAALTTAMQSDLPGQITALVNRNIYDSESGNYLLVPAGAILTGTYSDKIIAGQTRVAVAWTRIRMPNGSYVSIGNMPGTGPGGKSGFHDQVNNHTWLLFKNALLMSIVQLGMSVAQPGYGSAGGYGQQAISPAQTGEQSLAQNFGQAEANILQRYTNIAPTLIIRAGYQLNVAVTKDIVFPGPYTGKPAALPAAPALMADAAIANPYAGGQP
ncbi:MAG TPA: TrbI/VirB10 family protein [Acetobacteraceae bacterium]|nr:TrbI/VirB10 family protein [Acetobacteraceae bacterium]